MLWYRTIMHQFIYFIVTLSKAPIVKGPFYLLRVSILKACQGFFIAGAVNQQRRFIKFMTERNLSKLTAEFTPCCVGRSNHPSVNWLWSLSWSWLSLPPRGPHQEAQECLFSETSLVWILLTESRDPSVSTPSSSVTWPSPECRPQGGHCQFVLSFLSTS